MTGNQKLSAARILMALSLALHIVWFAFMSVGTWRAFGNFSPPAIADQAAERVDILATALAILGVIVGLAAIGGFVLVRREARESAAEAAREEVGAKMAMHVSECLGVTHKDLLQKLVVIALKENLYIIRSEIQPAPDIEEADKYTTAIPVKDPDNP